MTVPAVAVLDYLVNIIPHQNRMSRGDLMGKVSNEVYKRYADKTYNQYMLKLRKVEDAELIAKIEALKASGLSATGAIKRLIQYNNNK